MIIGTIPISYDNCMTSPLTSDQIFWRADWVRFSFDKQENIRKYTKLNGRPPTDSDDELIEEPDEKNQKTK